MACLPPGSITMVMSLCMDGESPQRKLFWERWVNPLRPRPNRRHFADDIFKCIFLNENVRISIKISLKFVPKSPIDNMPTLFQIMAWRRPGDKPLSEAMMASLLTHICVTRPQWVKSPWTGFGIQMTQWDVINPRWPNAPCGLLN